MKTNKKSYTTPHLNVLGNVQQLTQGPIAPSINDGLIGQGDNTSIGCQPSSFQGPDYKICDPGGLGS
jgi:hypothetical protein